MTKQSKFLDFRVLIFLFILINSFYFAYFAHQFNLNQYPGTLPLFFSQGETSTYFTPLENFVQAQGYSWFQATDRFGNSTFMASTRRVPGLGIVYVPLRLLFDSNLALNALIVMQWALYLAAWILLLKELANRTMNPNAFLLIAFSLVSVSTFDKTFNFLGLPESFSNSSLILCFFFYLKYLKEHKLKQVLLMGLFATWSVFLRPLTGLVFIPMSIALVVNNYSIFSLYNFKRLATLYAVLFITILSWGIRNYHKTGQVILLEDDITYSQPNVYQPNQVQMRAMAKAMGEQIFHWIPASFGDYFYNKPKEAFAEKYGWSQESKRHLENWHQSYFYFKSIQTPKNVDSLDNKFSEFTSKLIHSYKADNFIKYAFISKIKSLIHFYNKKTYSYLPFPSLANMNLVHKLLKSFEIFLHYSLLLGFIVYTALALVKNKQLKFDFMLIGYLILFSFISAMYFNATEPRYSISIYPVLLIINSLLLTNLFNLLQRKTKMSASIKQLV